MSKDVVGLISSVRKQKDIHQLRAINHVDKCPTFIFASPLLEQCVNINMAGKIIQCIQVKQIVGFLRFSSGKERIGIIRIGGSKKI